MSKHEIVTLFEKGTQSAKPMLRWWFPDADADLNEVKRMIEGFEEKGFGGVEIAMVPQNVDFDPKVYGWATPKWKELMKAILKAASPEFVVDFTITAHWPPALNTIDPNHPAAMQELAFTIEKIKPKHKGALVLPEQKIKDRDGSHSVPFLFTREFVAASIAKVKEVNGKRVTLEKGSLTSVTDSVKKQIDPSTGEAVFEPAGIPMDSAEFGDKEKLADKQYFYEIDLEGYGIDTDPSKGEAYAPGDWLLFSYYKQGTGQTLSGRDADFIDLKLPLADRMYATDYYSEVSTKAIIDYWDEYILIDDELVSLLKERKGAIFEDSIETTSDYILWTDALLSEFEQLKAYDLTKFLPLLIGNKGSEYRYITPGILQRQIRDDYENAMNALYIKHHVEGLQKWVRTFNYKYRAQSYGGFIDTALASTVVDIPEVETLGFCDLADDGMADYYRDAAGGVHLRGDTVLSQEALAMLMQAYALTWKDALKILNKTFVVGSNRAILHGASYDYSHNGVSSEWPGWHAFSNAFAESWTDRQPYWEDVNLWNDYINRCQTVLQYGKPRVDLAIFKKDWNPGKGYTSILDAGYSYDIVGPGHLNLAAAKVTDGVLAKEEVGYKALLIPKVRSLEKADFEILKNYAEAGLPIVFIGNLPQYAFSHIWDEGDFDKAVAELNELHNVYYVARESELLELLDTAHVVPSIKKCPERLRYSSREDATGTRYYYLLNWSEEPLSKTITLTGDGQAYALNPWSGEIGMMTSEAVHDGIEVTLNLGPNEPYIIAVSTENLSEADARQYGVKATEIVVEPKLDELVIKSFGPGEDVLKPQNSKITEVALASRELVAWEELDFSDEMLKQLKVDSGFDLSGIAEYSFSFEAKGKSATLTYEHGDDMITGIWINDEQVKGINHCRDIIALDGMLRDGENSLRIRLVSPLNNRMKHEYALYREQMVMGPPPEGAIGSGSGVESDTYDYGDPAPFMPPMPEKDPRDQHYGLKSVTIAYEV